MSLPGISAGQAFNATQAPDTFGAPGSLGQAANSHAPARQIFDPASLPPLPLNPTSDPGTAAPGTGVQGIQQPSSFAPPSASWPGTPSASSESAKAKPGKKRGVSGKRVLLALLVLLILGGGGALAYYQYSSGGAQPYQSFRSSALGVTLSYPQGWTAKVNQAQTSVYFADSNQTDQVTLSTATTNGQQISQYLTQESTQLGITGAHTGLTLTFAGTSWQEIQGSVTQKGVTNTLALYVTEHNNRFYTLILQAPTTTYAQIDQEDFKPLRNSFNFL